MLEKLVNGFEREKNLLLISSMFIAIFIFFTINFESFLLSYENALLTLLSLNTYFFIRLIIEWFHSEESIAKISIPFLIGVIAIGYVVYELSSISIVWDYTKLIIIVLLIAGEFIASTFSMNIEYIVYRRSDEESLKTYLPNIPFAVKSALKYIPIGLGLLLFTGLTAQFFLSDPVQSFWFIIILLPFSIHLLALGLYFLFLNKDYIDSRLKILDEQDKEHLLSQIGMKLANKKSKSCRKTTTQQYQTIVHFLNNGLDPNEIFEDRYTLLLPSTCCGDEKLVKLLIERGANVNFKSSLGMTPLILASQHGSYDLAQILLNNGADINIQGPQGKTALDFATENGFEDIAEILKKT